MGFIIGITGLLLLRAEAGSTGAARTPLMTIITIILLIIGAAIGYFILGKTTKPPTIAQPPKIMSTTKIIAVIVLGIIVGAVLAFLTGGTLIYIEAHTMETTCQWLEHHPELRGMGQQHSRTGSIRPGPSRR